MLVSKFPGIQQYHDGLAVSDYCNMIPLGDSIIDRQGESVCETGATFEADGIITVWNTFVDSLQNIYIATSDGLLRRYHMEDSEPIFDEIMDMPMVSADMTFCESSTKPSQVYCSSNGAVFYWNTVAIDYDESVVPEEYQNRYKAFSPVRLPIITSPEALVDKASAYSEDGAFFPEVNKSNYYLSNPDLCPPVSGVTWFDNRLVCISAETNTVFLTETDPSRFLVNATTGIPKSIVSPIETTESNDDYTADFMPNYYSSTASSARLQDAISFAGQLYFLNDTSIEIWSATGNYLNPIQHSASNTVYFGGRSPVIIANSLYLICKDAVHNEFIAAIQAGGQFQRCSNSEIESRLKSVKGVLKPLSIRDRSMFVCYTDTQLVNGYSMTGEGGWWRYNNVGWRKEYSAWSLLNRDGIVYNVSNRGRIVKVTDENRLFADGETQIPRHVRGAFTQFVGRKILRSVEVICDTGVHFGYQKERPKVYLRASFDRGLHFGAYYYRRFGSMGSNDRSIIWRNCGSGNSLMLEFGTADQLRLQIYSLDIELA